MKDQPLFKFKNKALHTGIPYTVGWNGYIPWFWKSGPTYDHFLSVSSEIRQKMTSFSILFQWLKFKVLKYLSTRNEPSNTKKIIRNSSFKGRICWVKWATSLLVASCKLLADHGVRFRVLPRLSGNFTATCCPPLLGWQQIHRPTIKASSRPKTPSVSFPLASWSDRETKKQKPKLKTERKKKTETMKLTFALLSMVAAGRCKSHFNPLKIQQTRQTNR